MDLFRKFRDYIQEMELFQPNNRLLVAVSGGVDSVVLCELCKMAGFTFSVAHCNFNLRGEESDMDEAFVRQLAKKYAAEIFVRQFETGTYAAEKKISIQEAARHLRYQWFKEIISEGKADVLLTAHHADDNIETLLMNFFKGTGMAGLQGIQPKVKGSSTRRPLLFASKDDIIQFALNNDIVYRDDSSNSSNKYTRNYFRNELIPGLEKVYPQVRDNLQSNLARFNDIGTLYRQAIDEAKKRLVFEQQGSLFIPVLKLRKTPAMLTVMHEIFSAFGFTPGQTRDIAALLKSESGKYVQSSTHRVLRDRKWLIISPLQSVVFTHYLIEKAGDRVTFPGGILSAEVAACTGNIPALKNMAMLNAANLRFPLMLRKWKTGDYFYPLGMKHKKKLSRFFIDNKFSLIEKENTWVVEMEKKIIWIVNHRIDERFRVDEKTKKVLKLTFTPDPEISSPNKLPKP